MEKDARMPWAQSTPGAVVISVILSPIVSAIATPLIAPIVKQPNSLPWPLIALIFVAVGVVVFLLASLLQKRLRSIIWVRPMRWMRGIRVTTARQRKAASNDSARKALSLLSEKTKALITNETQRADRAETEIEHLKTQNEGLELGLRMAKSKVSEAEKFAQAAQAELAAQQAPLVGPELPRPAPRWRIYADEDQPAGMDFVIANAVPRSIAREVRIEPDEDMEVLDAGHWEDLSGNAIGNFRAEMTSNGIDYGVNININWYDEQNQRRTTAVRVPGRDDRFAHPLRI